MESAIAQHGTRILACHFIFNICLSYRFLNITKPVVEAAIRAATPCGVRHHLYVAVRPRDDLDRVLFRPTFEDHRVVARREEKEDILRLALKPTFSKIAL